MRPINGGWHSLDTAPHDRAVLVLFMQSEKPAIAVGRFTHGKWLVRTPHSDERIEIYARRWSDIPPLPDVNSF